MKPGEDLLIVTTVTADYVKFLPDWAASIGVQTQPPNWLYVVGIGLRDPAAIREPVARAGPGGTLMIFDDVPACSPAAARNAAIAQVPQARWVMHLDADDVLYPSALESIAEVGDDADVIQAGYDQWWPHNAHAYRRTTIYRPLDGLEALSAPRIASGCSPFRRELWERWPYPQLQASWDYGLWLGFAHLGARFRPTRRPVFRYRQWGGSHWRRVGQYHHDDLLALRRRLEAEGLPLREAVPAPAPDPQP